MSEEIRVDLRKTTPDSLAFYREQAEAIFRFNHALPYSGEYTEAMKHLFEDRLGEGSYVAAPINGAALENLYIGKNVYINTNLLAMSRGGITIEDDVQIAANVQLLSNNHDPYDRQIIICKPIRIKKGAWIGAGASIMAGVTIGKYAIVGAASVVTHDVEDYEVVAGNPAKVIRILDAERFEDRREIKEVL